MGNSSLIKVLVPKGPSSGDLLKYLQEIEKNKWYTNFGPLHNQLIYEYSKYFKVNEDKIVLLSNATLAIAGAVATSGAKNKTWFVPSWTFSATPAAIFFGGGIPHFIDVDNDWRASLKLKYKNVLDVLPFGDSLRNNTQDIKNDFLVIDAAASFDALRNITLGNSRSIGVIVSLHATKLISSGEGGIFITNDSNWASRVRSWSRFGFETGSRISSNAGINAKISEYSAAVGLASFKKWSVSRSKILDLTEKVISISNKSGLEISPAMKKGYATPYWIVKLKDNNQKVLLTREFANSNIETRDWWENGCARMPAYKKYLSETLINTKNLSKTTIGLPFHLDLTDSDLHRIESTLMKIA